MKNYLLLLLILLMQKNIIEAENENPAICTFTRTDWKCLKFGVANFLIAGGIAFQNWQSIQNDWVRSGVHIAGISCTIVGAITVLSLIVNKGLEFQRLLAPGRRMLVQIEVPVV